MQEHWLQNPEIILADEPIEENLDSKTSDDIEGFLKRLKYVETITITHDNEVAERQ